MSGNRSVCACLCKHVCVCETHGGRVVQLPQVDVLHRRLEGAQAVAELVLAGVTEAEVPDVAQVGHPAGGEDDQTRTVTHSGRCLGDLNNEVYSNPFIKTVNQGLDRHESQEFKVMTTKIFGYWIQRSGDLPNIDKQVKGYRKLCSPVGNFGLHQQVEDD